MRRTPLRPSTKALARRTLIARESNARRNERVARREALDEVRRRDGPLCRIDKMRRDGRTLVTTVELGPCGGYRDGHEVIPRSRWPGGHLVPSNIVLLCRLHHEWVHRNEVDARILGLLSPSWARPS